MHSTGQDSPGRLNEIARAAADATSSSTTKSGMVNRSDRKRGLVVSSPVVVDGGELIAPRGWWLDPQELRLGILYWDRLRWPQSGAFGHGIGRDEQWLLEHGILDRPRFDIDGDVATAVAAAHILGYQRSEAENPGCWAIAQGENSMVIRGLGQDVGRSLLVELYRAIPVPDVVVPFDEIIDFRKQHLQDLRNLRNELEDIYLVADASSDRDLAVARALEKIDAACEQAIKAATSSGLPFRLSDWKLSFKTPVGAIAAGWLAGQQFGLPATGAILGGVMSCLSMGKDIVLRQPAAGVPGPYRYVYKFHDDLFR